MALGFEIPSNDGKLCCCIEVEAVIMAPEKLFLTLTFSLGGKQLLIGAQSALFTLFNHACTHLQPWL